MDLPSSRELELETLLRQRDAQVTELTDEVTQLRQYLSKQPGPSTSDPVSLPPALVSLLLPHLNGPANNNAQTSSSTATTALTQRAKLLQEENDELYEMLKTGETGRLKEEVRGLKRAVGRLETALRESHQVIRTLSEELDKSYETILSTGRHHNAHAHSQAPRQSHRQSPALSQTNSNGTSKPLPTGPRAHKKPRLDPQVQAQPQAQAQPSPSSSSSTTTLPRIQTQTQNSNNNSNPTANSSNSANTRPAVETASVERSPIAASPDHRKVPGGMKVEINEDTEDSSSWAREPALPRDRGRNRERERDKDKGRERDKERDRDRDRLSKRNGGPGHGSGGVGGGGGGGSGGSGGGSGGGGGGGRGGSGGAKGGNRGVRGSFSSAVDRTLAQRMGMGRYSGPG